MESQKLITKPQERLKQKRPSLVIISCMNLYDEHKNITKNQQAKIGKLKRRKLYKNYVWCRDYVYMFLFETRLREPDMPGDKHL